MSGEINAMNKRKQERGIERDRALVQLGWSGKASLRTTCEVSPGELWGKWSRLRGGHSGKADRRRPRERATQDEGARVQARRCRTCRGCLARTLIFNLSLTGRLRVLGQ